MTTRDFPAASGRITRIEAARRTVEDFALGRPDDLVGLVAFANFPETACPPTLDHEFLAAEARGLKTASGLDDGTNLGDAIAWSLHELEGLPRRAQGADPSQPTAGTTPACPIPLTLKRRRGWPARWASCSIPSPSAARGRCGRSSRRPAWRSPPRFPVRAPWTCWPASPLGGGRSFVAADAAVLDEVFREIDRLETSPVTGTIRTRYEEHFPPLCFTALASLLTAAPVPGSPAPPTVTGQDTEDLCQ